MKVQDIARTVNAWDVIPLSEKTILLVGLTNSGRTTIAQLINKFQFKVQNKGLYFEKQYLLEGAIIAKSIKIQTTLPRFYPSTNPEQPNILDVPCYIFTPDKKWTSFEQKLTTNLMMEHLNKVGFVFFIDEKNTRTNILSWKKTFYGVLQIFKEYPEDLLNSIGAIVTKCPSDINEESISKRLKKLQDTIKEEKQVDSGLIDKLFGSMIKQSHYFVGRKSTGNIESEEKQIQGLFKAMIDLPNYQARKEHLTEKMNWNADDEALIRQYYEACDEDFKKFLTGLKNILDYLPNLNVEKVQQCKKNHYSPRQNEEIVRPEVSKRLKDEGNSIQTWQIIKAFRQTRKILQKHENQKDCLDQVIQSLMNFPFFFRNSPDQQEFQKILEAVRFSKSSGIHSQCVNSMKLIRQIFEASRQNFFQKISQMAEDNDNLEFYQNSIQLLEEEKNLSKQVNQFLQKCKQSIVNFRSPKKLLEKLLDQMQSTQDVSKQVEIADKMSTTMEKEGLIKEASQIFRMVKNPGGYLRCFQQIEVENKDSALSYISYLADMYLFETAKRACYDFCAKFGISTRHSFGEKLNNLITLEQNYLKSKGGNILLQEVKLSSQEVNQIIELCKTVCANLKDD